jgi:hypothetical protein
VDNVVFAVRGVVVVELKPVVALKPVNVELRDPRWTVVAVRVSPPIFCS